VVMVQQRSRSAFAVSIFLCCSFWRTDPSPVFLFFFLKFAVVVVFVVVF
jgi:hypothetical protein